ncbi:hypothetical protein GCM10023189_20330 [Nibrella saemangeumensis]|uniref:DUF3999 domain-containing protein n=1 Tax=Nibrella saemangeumensis TaxID=1084526 RepID=A0ABP8MTG9_9BACT
MQKYVWVTLIFLLAGWSVSWGQSFRMEARVQPVTQSGYYRILLPPAVVGALNHTLTNIRLYDAKKREVPYLLTHQLPRQQTQLKPLPVISRIAIPGGTTTLVVRNAARNPISALGLTIKNSNVTKQAQLSGSNDTRVWYAIEDDYRLTPARSDSTTSAVKTLDFPLSDYEYYRLAINDSLTAPLNILNAGLFTSRQETGTYSALSGGAVFQRDSSRQKRSYVRLSLPDTVRVDKLTLVVQSPGPYRRSAAVAVLRPQRRVHRRPEPVFETVRTFELSSTGDQTVHLSGVRAKDLYVVIDNQDSSPLLISAVKAYQADVYLIARLVAGTSYQLRFGNPTLAAPVYDLAYFKDSIPGNLPVVKLADVSTQAAGRVDNPSFFSRPWLLWLALGLVLVLLSFLSYRMLTEMGKGS